METLAKKLEENIEKTLGTTRDAAITTGLHMWACLEVRDECIAIGVRINTCRDPWGSNWGLFWNVYCIVILLVWLCDIVWGVLLPILWETFLYNLFLFWIRFTSLAWQIVILISWNCDWNCV